MNKATERRLARIEAVTRARAAAHVPPELAAFVDELSDAELDALESISRRLAERGMTLAVQSRRPVDELTDQQCVEEWRRLSRRSVEDMQRDLLAEAARHAQSSEGFAR